MAPKALKTEGNNELPDPNHGRDPKATPDNLDPDVGEQQDPKSGPGADIPGPIAGMETREVQVAMPPNDDLRIEPAS